MKINIKSILNEIKEHFIFAMPLFSLIKYFFVIATYLFIGLSDLDFFELLTIVAYFSIAYLVMAQILKIFIFQLNWFKNKKHLTKQILKSSFVIFLFQVPIIWILLAIPKILTGDYHRAFVAGKFNLSIFPITSDYFIFCMIFIFIYIYLVSFIEQYFYGNLKREKFEDYNNIIFYSNLALGLIGGYLLLVINTLNLF